MPRDVLDNLVATLSVRVHAFSICEVRAGWRLAFDPLNMVTIHHVLAGSGILMAGGVAAPYATGQIVVVPARLAQEFGDAAAIATARADENCRVVDDGLVKFIAGDDGEVATMMACGTVSADYAGALGLFDHLRAPLIEDIADDAMIAELFTRLLAEAAAPGLGSQALAEALMRLCLVILLRRRLQRGDLDSPLFAGLHDERLTRAVVRVLDEPAAPHSVESLADTAGMSRAAFALAFARAFALTPIDFVQAVRLRIGAKLLVTTEIPVKTIANASGYQSRSYFSRAFRAAYGVDPKTYRIRGDDSLRPSTAYAEGTDPRR